MLRRFLLPFTVLVLLAACSGDDSGGGDGGDSDPAVDAVEVVAGEDGAAPTLEFDTPLEVEDTVVRVLREGDGDELEEGMTAIFDFVFVNGVDGEQVGSSYDIDPAEVPFTSALAPAVYEGLEGQAEGAEVLVAFREGEETVLFYAHLLEVRTPLERAEGAAQTPPAGLPAVEVAEDGTPTITIGESAAPTELVVQPLIVGDGPPVEAGQRITVHYVGVLHDGGEVFDSSWESGEPATFAIGTEQVIAGWDEGLVGQTVGSQVLLVIPAEDGYGATGQGETIPPDADLVFVVDILDAHDPIER